MTITGSGKTTIENFLLSRLKNNELTLQVGDSLTIRVQQPVPRTIRMTLATQESCAYAKELLLKKDSSWILERSSK